MPFTIVITGTNDKPTIDASGSTITGQIGTGNTVTVDTVTGTVTFTDPDLTDRSCRAEISATDPFRYYDAEGNDVRDANGGAAGCVLAVSTADRRADGRKHP